MSWGAVDAVQKNTFLISIYVLSFNKNTLKQDTFTWET